MTGQGIVTKLTGIESIKDADFIVQAKILGETIIVSKDTPENTLGILFDIETQLSPEFLKNNNLFRHSELNSDANQKGYFDDNGRVRPIRLKGVKVTGFWIPIESVAYTGISLKENDLVDTLGKHEIAKKYIRPFKQAKEGQPRVRPILCEMFKEHSDTEHLLRSLHQVPVGPFIITKKLHGTSGRYAKLLVNKPLTWWEKAYAKFFTYEPKIWANIVGSRKVIKSIEGIYNSPGNHFYNEDIWTKASHEVFGDRLLKGETVYFELVGYTAAGAPVQAGHETNPLEKFLDKADYKLVKEQFGDQINFTYGANDGKYDIYVYRITHTTVDGDSIDLGWEQVKQRCERLGVKHVPEIAKGNKTLYEKRAYYCPLFNSGNELTDDRDFSWEIENWANNAHHNGSYAEGICLRSETYPRPAIFKHKNSVFKFLEHGAKDTIIDIEENQ